MLKVSLLLCLLSSGFCSQEAHEHKDAVTRGMISQPNLSVTAV